MNASPGNFPFDEFFGPPLPGDPQFQVQQSGQPGELQFVVFDRLIVFGDQQRQSVTMVMWNSEEPDQAGAGVMLTVAQASRVISLLRESISHVEEMPPPRSECIPPEEDTR